MLLEGQPDIVVEPVVEPPLLVVDVVLLLAHIVPLAAMAATYSHHKVPFIDFFCICFLNPKKCAAAR